MFHGTYIDMEGQKVEDQNLCSLELWSEQSIPEADLCHATVDRITSVKHDYYILSQNRSDLYYIVLEVYM